MTPTAPLKLLNRDSVAGTAVGTGANLDIFIECGGNSTLVLEVDMSAGAAPDLSVQVNPVAEDGEIYPLAQPAVQSVGPTLIGGRSYYWGAFDITSQQRVRVRINNANAGSQNVDYSYRMA